VRIRVEGAREHNLADVDVEFGDGLTVVTGVSGSGKSSLVFDTIHHEARRRFFEVYAPPSASQRLAPAEVRSIRGLLPSVAIGQNLLNRNPNSTVATASGLHPYLRLLFARFGTRHCAQCGEELLHWLEEDAVRQIVEHSRDGGVDVRAQLIAGIAGTHATLLGALAAEFPGRGILVDGKPYRGRRLNAKAPHAISVELRVRSEGPVRARDARTLYHEARGLGADRLELEGAVRLTLALTPVCSRCGSWFSALEPMHFHTPCPGCGGEGCARCEASGIHPEAAAVRWQQLTLRELLQRSVDEASSLIEGADRPATARRVLSEIARRLDALARVGLGYLQLDRAAPTLSRGEGQRVRLAVSLTSRLEEILHVLDEPTVGLHAADVANVMSAIERLPGPVIYVEHDRVAAAKADRAIDTGPGAGTRGGRIVFEGTPRELWDADTPTGRAFSLRESVELPEQRPAPDEFLTIRKAALRNLRAIDVSLALGRFNVISGVSGSGKSTLVEDVLVASLREGRCVGCEALSGFEGEATLVDQSPIGRNPRSNPATYTKLADVLRDGFASATDLSASHFSFNRAEGACPQCEGMGAVEVKMRYLPSTWIRCDACEGLRFSDEVRERRAVFGGRELSITDALSMSVDEMLVLMSGETPLKEGKRRQGMRILRALSDIGLGYLRLGQPSPSLSGGEAQRVKLARHLGARSFSGKLLVLDEPTTGLHPRDVRGLLMVLDRLVRHGATLVIVEHNLDLVRAADWLVDLGPGCGPEGGELLYAGPPAGIASVQGSITAEAMRRERRLRPRERARGVASSSKSIRVEGARANNLCSVDVEFPHGALSVVTGVSGSGKSSLVRDVIEIEAKRRFLESLSMYERQGVREGAEPDVVALAGLGVSVPLAGESRLRNPRASVGSTSEISQRLAVLLARVGVRVCKGCGREMARADGEWRCEGCGETAALSQPRHFIPTIYGSACTTCQGVGSLREPRPDKPLCAGAMYSPGFFPQGFYGKPYNSGYDVVQAIAGTYDFDPFETPWCEMSKAAQDAFLFGLPEPFAVTYRSRTGRVHTRETTFLGFFGIIGNWDVGGTYTAAKQCPQCGGGRLRREHLQVTLNGLNMQALAEMPLDALRACLAEVNLPDAEVPLAGNALAALRRDLALICELGLGYLELARSTSTLSAGEAQRLQLVRIISGGLSGLTVLLDEPTRGMHPREIDALVKALRKITSGGNTAIVIEHDLGFIRASDHVVDMGPGPGVRGGRVVATGTPMEISRAEGATARWLRRRSIVESRARRAAQGWLTIEGARANNLQNIDVRIPKGSLVGICGVSGSGKSTLIMDTLARVVAPKKHTTSVAREDLEPGAHDRIIGAPPRCVVLDQSREGIMSPGSYLGVKRALIQLYTASEAARALGLDQKALAARCETCKGGGISRIDMGFLPNVHAPCEACAGSGFAAEVNDVGVRGSALPALLGKTIDEVLECWKDEPSVAGPLLHARTVGLGYLVLQQPALALSGGEVQRLRIARELGHKQGAGLYLLDEPSVGQHMDDVARLGRVLTHLVDSGATVLIVEHHPELLATCDWLIELGPEGGPGGGRVVAEGTPETVASGASPTATYMREVLA
jgi:excinuclease ABC subunit A